MKNIPGCFYRDTKRGYGLIFSWLKQKSLGYEHLQYDGHFYILNCYFFSLMVATNPHCWLTPEEIEVNVKNYFASQNKELL